MFQLKEQTGPFGFLYLFCIAVSCTSHPTTDNRISPTLGENKQAWWLVRCLLPRLAISLAMVDSKPGEAESLSCVGLLGWN